MNSIIDFRLKPLPTPRKSLSLQEQCLSESGHRTLPQVWLNCCIRGDSVVWNTTWLICTHAQSNTNPLSVRLWHGTGCHVVNCWPRSWSQCPEVKTLSGVALSHAVMLTYRIFTAPLHVNLSEIPWFKCVCCTCKQTKQTRVNTNYYIYIYIYIYRFWYLYNSSLFTLNKFTIMLDSMFSS